MRGNNTRTEKIAEKFTFYKKNEAWAVMKNEILEAFQNEHFYIFSNSMDTKKVSMGRRVLSRSDTAPILYLEAVV